MQARTEHLRRLSLVAAGGGILACLLLSALVVAQLAPAATGVAELLEAVAREAGSLAAPGFWVGEGVKFTLLYLVAYLAGLLVVHKGVRVNYTRKINHFALFFLPIFLAGHFEYERTGATRLASALLFLLLLATYSRAVRERVPLFATMFRSFDRPEDRPFTLIWLSTQIVAGFLVLLPLLVTFARWGVPELIYIPILVNAVGDGLAEPVGVRYGRHTYRVRALFTEKQYTRSLEGSACVFLTCVVVICLFRESFTPAQFWTALAAVPILMTLAEARSPHTWDTPILFVVGGLSLLGIVGLV